MRRLLEWIWRVPENPKIVSVLVWVNLLGAVYGFDWYRIQLSQTRLAYWPVVPDSPLSTLLFGIMLAMLSRGRRPEALMGLSYVSMAKYGVWTVIVFLQAWATRGYAYWEEVFLSGSHFAMALEAALFYRVFTPKARYLLIAGAWSLFNDYMDYVHGFHPYLPFNEHLPSIRLYTPALTVLVVLVYIIAHRHANQGAEWFERRQRKRLTQSG